MEETLDLKAARRDDSEERGEDKVKEIDRASDLKRGRRKMEETLDLKAARRDDSEERGEDKVKEIDRASDLKRGRR
ncbi:hypothetical protein F2Q68_00028910 [Brassica cretica]|uniref:Uncharacterized protein n=1 Tax=Brassica cretica TaxID=69181 RepID=A0A8S9GAV2_BRACR|nr:hypothetical protein F2Q68_00028910 [Brassica cretica]